MKKAIVTDIDQVLLDYASRLREYVNKRDGKSITGHSLNWDLAEWLELGSSKEALDTIIEFSTTYEFGTLDALPGADVVLHNLVRKGYSLIGLTASGNSPMSVALRKVNLFHRFGDIFDDVLFVEHHESKVDSLTKIMESYDVRVFIDDKPANIMDTIDYVPNVILMKSPHNREFRKESTEMDIDTAFSWYECEHLIDGYK